MPPAFGALPKRDARSESRVGDSRRYGHFQLSALLPFKAFPLVSSRQSPMVIGVLGGIGSGKSAVTQALSNTLPILILDADKAGHEALTHARVQGQIRQRFGDEVFDAQGQVNRQALAEKVFGTDPHQQQARLDLNRIVHPEIQTQLLETIRRASPDIEVILLDAAVMVEAGWDHLCDAVVFIDSSWESRLARVQARGWTEEELRRREASQLSLEQKRQRANIVIDNSRNLDDAVQQLRRFVELLCETA